MDRNVFDRLQITTRYDAYHDTITFRGWDPVCLDAYLAIINASEFHIDDAPDKMNELLCNRFEQVDAKLLFGR